MNFIDRKDNFGTLAIKNGKGVCFGYTIVETNAEGGVVSSRDFVGMTRGRAREMIGLPAMIAAPEKRTKARSEYPQYTGGGKIGGKRAA